MPAPAPLAVPQPNQYALGPLVAAGLIGLLLAWTLTPVRDWVLRRARGSAQEWLRSYYQRQVERAMPYMVRLRMGESSRADLLAEWQRVKTERLIAQVTLLLGFAVTGEGLRWTAIPGGLLVAWSLWQGVKFAGVESDIEFAARSEDVAAIREPLDAMIEKRVRELTAAWREEGRDGNPGPALDSPTSRV